MHYPIVHYPQTAWAAATAYKRGREELPHIRGQGRRPRETTPRPRSGAEDQRSNPTSEVRGGSREELPHVQGAVAARAQEGLEELLHFQCQEGRLVQGKKQWLHFAGADVKRYPMSKVREIQGDGRYCERASEGRHTETIITEH